MRAFYGDEGLRQQIIGEMKAHIAADELVQYYGYWRDGKGCMLGCLTGLNEGTHEAFESRANIPLSLGWVFDSMFQGLPKEDARAFPMQVLESIQAGADLAHVATRFVMFVLGDVKRYADDAGKVAIDTCVALYCRRLNNDEPSKGEWFTAESAARSAAWSAAESAARSAARSAAWQKYRDELLRLLREAK